MDKMDIDKVQVEDDVHIPEDIERASLEKLNNRGILSDIGGVKSVSQEIRKHQRVESFGRHSSPEKMNEFR